MPHINVSINDTAGTTVSANGTTTDPEVIAAALVIFNKLTKAASDVPTPAVPAEPPAAPETPTDPLPEPEPEAPQDAEPETPTEPVAAEPAE